MKLRGRDAPIKAVFKASLLNDFLFLYPVSLDPSLLFFLHRVNTPLGFLNGFLVPGLLKNC